MADLLREASLREHASSDVGYFLSTVASDDRSTPQRVRALLKEIVARIEADAAGMFETYIHEWNSTYEATRSRAEARCFRGPASLRRPFGEFVTEELGFGAPPYEGMRPLSRLLAEAIRSAFDGVGPDHPLYALLLTACMTRDLERVVHALQDRLQVASGTPEEARARAAVALGALARIRDVERGGPRRSGLSARGVLAAARAEGALPTATTAIVERFLQDDLPESDLVREGHAVLRGRSADAEARGVPSDGEAETTPNSKAQATEQWIFDLRERQVVLNGEPLPYGSPSRGGQMTVRHSAFPILLKLASGDSLPRIQRDTLRDLRRGLERATGNALTVSREGGVYFLSDHARVTERLLRCRPRM